MKDYAYNKWHRKREAERVQKMLAKRTDMTTERQSTDASNLDADDFLEDEGPAGVGPPGVPGVVGAANLRSTLV